jgi:asparagine synthase (glutamine-hydrolysing)
VPGILRAPLGAAIGAAPRGLVNSLLNRGGTWAPNTRARLIRELRDSSRTAAYENLLAKWVSPSDVMSPAYATALRSSDAAWPPASSEPEARMAFDMQHYMPDDILVKVDRSAMACSLETRAPLIDHRVVEFALRTPLQQKIREGRGKFLLRHLLARYIPQSLIDRPKQGFSIPLSSWLRGPLRDWGSATLEPDSLLKSWFQAPVVSALWEAHLRGADHAERLWPLLMVMQWLRANQAAMPA